MRLLSTTPLHELPGELHGHSHIGKRAESACRGPFESGSVLVAVASAEISGHFAHPMEKKDKQLQKMIKRWMKP